MRVAPLDSPSPTVQRQEAVKPDPAPQPEAKQAEPGLGFISPVIHVDSEAGVAILQYRDKISGDVTAQFPSETVVKRYREGEVVAHQGQPAQSGQTAGTFSPSGSTGTSGGETSAAPAPASPAPGGGGSGGGTSTGGGEGSSGGGTAKG